MIETFTEHRSLLFGIAYRMLGRATDAEDMVQETWLRWQRQDAAQIQSAKAWLISTITRLCIDRLRSAQHEREHYYGVWLPEPLVTAHAPAGSADAAIDPLADSLTIAFMRMLDALSPVERAAFILRQVFDYDYDEIAAIVQKSEPNCRQIVSRAKAQLARPIVPAAPPSEKAEQLVQQFLRARATGDLDQLLALLTDDAVLYSDGGGRAYAAGHPIEGAGRIGRLFASPRTRLSPNTEYVITTLNGHIGALLFRDGQLHDAYSFEFDGDRLSRLYIVRNPDKLRHLSAPQCSALRRLALE